MKNYARKTNRNVTRYRTPATFRVRAVMVNQKSRLDNSRFGKNTPPHHQDGPATNNQ
jgi:hypothetical protein